MQGINRLELLYILCLCFWWSKLVFHMQREYYSGDEDLNGSSWHYIGVLQCSRDLDFLYWAPWAVPGSKQSWRCRLTESSTTQCLWPSNLQAYPKFGVPQEADRAEIQGHCGPCHKASWSPAICNCPEISFQHEKLPWWRVNLNICSRASPSVWTL